MYMIRIPKMTGTQEELQNTAMRLRNVMGLPSTDMMNLVTHGGVLVRVSDMETANRVMVTLYENDITSEIHSTGDV